jgi:RNA polymerase sigma-70 factor (ECF subfamily)
VSLASPPGRRDGEAVPEAINSPDGSAIRREEAATLNQVLDRLPPEYRRVLQLRYWSGMSFVDMAPQLGRSPDAARKLWYRALERLQSELAMEALPQVSQPD